MSAKADNALFAAIISVWLLILTLAFAVHTHDAKLSLMDTIRLHSVEERQA